METITEKNIASIMTRKVYTVSTEDSLIDAKNLLRKHKVRHVPVVDAHSKKLVGILSLTDIMRLTFGGMFDEQTDADEAVLTMLSVEQVMKYNPKTVKPSDNIVEVAKMLTKEEFHALPVEEDGKLSGIVTTTDIINFLLEQHNS